MEARRTVKGTGADAALAATAAHHATAVEKRCEERTDTTKEPLLRRAYEGCRLATAKQRTRQPCQATKTTQQTTTAGAAKRIAKALAIRQILKQRFAKIHHRATQVFPAFNVAINRLVHDVAKQAAFHLRLAQLSAGLRHGLRVLLLT